MQIEEFNVDVGVFLRKLQHFAAASKQINVSTANLLAETISGIENLLEDVDIKADESEAAQQNDVFAKFDGEIYKLQHYAACRLCNVSALWIKPTSFRYLRTQCIVFFLDFISSKPIAEA